MLYINKLWYNIFMRYYKEIIDKAKKLRRSGKTYSEISSALGMPIPKSTLSVWCHNEELPEWFHEKVEQLNAGSIRRAQQMARVVHQRNREARRSESARSATKALVHTDDVGVLKMLLAVLYAGEGSKLPGHYGLVLGSSDSDIIRLYITLLRKCFGITLEKLRCRISYRADQDIAALQTYWSHVTLIPLRNFYKTKFDPRTIGKPTKKPEYKGVCVISCPGTREQIELEILAKLIVDSLG